MHARSPLLLCSDRDAGERAEHLLGWRAHVWAGRHLWRWISSAKVSTSSEDPRTFLSLSSSFFISLPKAPSHAYTHSPRFFSNWSFHFFDFFSASPHWELACSYRGRHSTGVPPGGALGLPSGVSLIQASTFPLTPASSPYFPSLWYHSRACVASRSFALVGVMPWSLPLWAFWVLLNLSVVLPCVFREWCNNLTNWSDFFG